MKELWMDEVERIREDFQDGKLEKTEAIIMLTRKGFDFQEAKDMLEELER